ncbi:hypothetical protein PR202_gb23584 [Eleusine coracana subsp. coracana]|uniref:Uncharacterized protein n=1 Tax=Eleusine coracana subsp. coracana TaxID=191504 RepID=A0AAV5FJD7_ELECO|nr:hypothetical protein PR202_gb23584 [Eleusine coracana subsp. coracana]
MAVVGWRGGLRSGPLVSMISNAIMPEAGAHERRRPAANRVLDQEVTRDCANPFNNRRVRSLQNLVWHLENRVRELSDERQVYGYRMRDLVRRNGELSHEKSKLEKQLEEKTRVTLVFSRQVTMQEHRVIELKHKNEELFNEKVKLNKQLEDARSAGLLFMIAADQYQEVAEKKVKVMMEELKDTRKVGMMFMNAADEYQDVVEKEFEVKVEELSDTKKAGLLLMNVADEYQEVIEKEFKAKVEELKDTRMGGQFFMNAADDYQEMVEKEYKAKVEELKDTRTAGLLFMDAADQYQEAVEKEAKAKSMEFQQPHVQHAKMDTRATSLESKEEELEANVMMNKRKCDAVKEEYDTIHLKALTLEDQSGVEVERHNMKFVHQ